MLYDDKRDVRGYLASDHKKVSDFLEVFQVAPEEFPEFKDKIFNPDNLLDPKTKKPIEDPDEKLRRAVELHVFGRRDIDLGESSWIKDETAIVGRCPRCSWKCRRCHGHSYVWFSHPALDEIWEDVKTCATVAGTLAIIEAIWASPSAGVALFKEQFYLCLSAKGIKWAKDIDIGAYTERVCGDWHGCG